MNLEEHIQNLGECHLANEPVKQHSERLEVIQERTLSEASDNNVS